VIEIENLIYTHPSVHEVALVGLPDARLGERACAVVVVREGAVLDHERLCEHLVERGVSKHFLPERLEIVPELPKTMSGKVRKVALREALSGQIGARRG
jgi:cyclohexanecarboxylate-CoA ligase